VRTLDNVIRPSPKPPGAALPESEDRHFHALPLLQANPALSQRALARELGVSVGAANYCVRALVAKGWIKIQNFRTSKDKRAYAYLLTPHGVEQKAQLTLRFLQRKEAEYLALEAEIARLRLDVHALHTDAVPDLDPNA
jgi:MarR family transcriptional regulator, temperature-dependent positive regulator of motility